MYQLINGQAVKVQRKGYDASKPGLVRLLRSEFPKGQEQAALAYAAALESGDTGADWDRNGEISRGVSVRFVVDAIRDMVNDRVTDDKAMETGRVDTEQLLFAKALQHAATVAMTPEDFTANSMYQAGARGFLHAKTGELTG